MAKFSTDSEKLCVSLRYGAQVIEIAKGKTAVQLASTDQLVRTLEILKTAIEGGKLDAQLEACGVVRAGIKK